MSAACLHAIFRALTLPDPECMSLKQSMPFITHCLISTQKLAKPEFLENSIIFEIVQAVPSMLHYIRKICGLPNCISTVLAGGGGTNSKKSQIFKLISLVACDAVAAIVKSAISNLDQSSMEETCVSLTFSQASGLLKAGHKASATEAIVHAIHLLLEESVAKEVWHCSATLISLTCKLSMYVPPLRRRILSKWPLSILDNGDGLAISQILSKPLFEYQLQLSWFEKDLKMLHIVAKTLNLCCRHHFNNVDYQLCKARRFIHKCICWSWKI
jgi:hypothetical protein